MILWMDFILGHLNLVMYVTVLYITFILSLLYYRHQRMISKYVIRKIFSTPPVCKIFIVPRLVFLAVFLPGYVTYITFLNVTRQTCLTFVWQRPVDCYRSKNKSQIHYGETCLCYLGQQS